MIWWNEPVAGIGLPEIELRGLASSLLTLQFFQPIE